MLNFGPQNLDALPVFVDRIDERGRISYLNEYEARALGWSAVKLQGEPLETIYSSQSAKMIRGLATKVDQGKCSFPVWMKSVANQEIPLIATAFRDAEQGWVILKQLLTPDVLDTAVELVERVEILSQMIGSATEACWCIEFLEPIDVSLAEDEIVDRIFSHQKRWRACNDAMARLYRIPDGLDFNTQPVERYFPDTSVNRRMVRDLVRSSYRLDRAVATDRRHDGSEMLVENDFRAAIEGSSLIRLWGTVRDIGPSKRREQQLSDHATAMLDILSALPDPVLVLAGDGMILAANPAAEAAWGRSVDSLLGNSIEQILEGRGAVPKLLSSPEGGLDVREGCDLTVLLTGGNKDVWRFRVAVLEGDLQRYVLTARLQPRRKARSQIMAPTR
ncbi:PAS domain-containing protein [Aureimonas ureilytica]|uniref:PAS domain-containing protein n=1 Tax=Aureimonas ureilytica TaxID=401562 RepID=UPI000734ED94|nr:PAS domain-containing protein [Aureimonas ureilytica]